MRAWQGDREEVHWGEFGRVVGKDRKRVRQTNNCFASSLLPIPCETWAVLLRDDREARVVVRERIGAETDAVHLWNEMWRLGGADKAGSWPRECLYERLKRRYEDEGSDMSSHLV